MHSLFVVIAPVVLCKILKMLAMKTIKLFTKFFHFCQPWIALILLCSAYKNLYYYHQLEKITIYVKCNNKQGFLFDLYSPLISVFFFVCQATESSRRRFFVFFIFFQIDWYFTVYIIFVLKWRCLSVICYFHCLFKARRNSLHCQYTTYLCMEMIVFAEETKMDIWWTGTLWCTQSMKKQSKFA
jgi:hypothetical protein